MVDIQSPTAEIRRGKIEERRRRKKKSQDENIMVCPITQGDHKQYSNAKNLRISLTESVLKGN